MSETAKMTQWASMATVADMLVSADSIYQIAFYTSKRDNGPTELNCRCFVGPGMSKESIDALMRELNDAIAPVLMKAQRGLQSAAANQLRRFL
jgi:hypothetical protein